MWAVGWQGAQDVKRSERPRPVSAGAAARNHARSYDMKLLTLNAPRSAVDAGPPKSRERFLSKIYVGDSHEGVGGRA